MSKHSFQLIEFRKITIIPNVENKLLEESRQNFLDYISSKTIVFTQDIALASGRMDSLFIKAEEAFTKLSSEVKLNTPEELFCNGENFKKGILNFSVDRSKLRSDSCRKDTTISYAAPTIIQ